MGISTLTIIESPPKTALKYPHTDTAINNWVALYTGKWPFFRASSLAELRDEVLIKNASEVKKYERLQLVGHGASGLLSVGWTWKGQYREGTTGPVYLLDGNPYSYRVLHATTDDLGEEVSLIPPNIKEILLVGCNIGGGDPLQTQVTVANGDTLIADLAQMWGRTVSATTGLVSTSAVVDGLYTGPAVVWSWNPLSRDSRGPTLAEPALEDRSEGPVTFTRLLSAPVLGPLDRDFNLSMPAQSEISTMLSTAFTLQGNVPALLALPELIFEVTWKGISFRANLIHNHRYLQLINEYGEIVITFATPPGQPDDMGRKLRRWLESLIA